MRQAGAIDFMIVATPSFSGVEPGPSNETPDWSIVSVGSGYVPWQQATPHQHEGYSSGQTSARSKSSYVSRRRISFASPFATSTIAGRCEAL